MKATAKLLDVRGLSTWFFTKTEVVRAVDGVTFDLDHGETLGLVGESGCGKTVTALSISRLLPKSGRVVGGEVLFEGIDLLRLTEAEMRHYRGRRIGFIFQDPMTSLNPTLAIGYQIAESARFNLGLSRRAARMRTIDFLGMVGIPRPHDRYGDYPHEFSGGMRQRVMIAMALICNPSLLLADEPTTALDVTIQAQILELVKSLSQDLGTAVLFITHDLGIAAAMCDRVNVMYAGEIVETAPVDAFFSHPAMPYVWGLLSSMPRLTDELGQQLVPIDGLPPELTAVPPGCRFLPRCRFAHSVCNDHPPLTPRSGADHLARCWGTDEGGWLL